ncbi:serine hydrolase [Streptomyces longisporoflavus]|uniref:serine hydrolase domain-containing protein n=1 Tax=Streptomyces longisporoflavus TaxID=28044 RepID=UPI00167EF76E|nr:serine hydrolase domain-containing protein [Streptomyces longisporoflavus]GGV49602.1 serine hydrolase [Streptomyces longisporoflavus]
MTSPREELLPATRRSLLHRVATAQAEGRAPSLVASVLRDGELVWTAGRTCVEGHAPDENVQYRIGSITKTFTAVLVMRLRDEGALDLSDPLEKHLPGTAAGDVTIAELLAHTSGLAAETPGEWWERTPGAQRPELGDVLGEHPFKHATGRRFHYSNPGYTLLGSLIEALRGDSWEAVLRREILEPLGLDRTSAQPQAPHAGGWAVHPWADVMMPEPAEDLGLMAPAGQLWSTTADLARFGAFLLEGDKRILSADSVREMRVPASPPLPGDWNVTYGLGTQLIRGDGRTLVGHGGSLPGFMAGLWASEEDGLVAVTLTNCTSGPAVTALAFDLLKTVAEAEPRIPAAWRPLPELDAALLELAGPWYWGTSTYVVRPKADGALELAPLTGWGRGSWFRPNGDGTWTGRDGYFAGEQLRVVRRPDKSVSHLDLGSFFFTREPYDAEAPVPGGVDPEGWRGLSR